MVFKSSLNSGGSGTVTLVSNSDGSISVATGSTTPVVTVNVAHAFAWTASHSFTTSIASAISFTLKSSAAQLVFGELVAGSTFYGFTGNASGMSAGGYAVISDGTNTYVNAPSGGEVAIRINNSTQLSATSSGIVATLDTLKVASPNCNIIGDELSAGNTFAGLRMGNGITGMSSNDYAIISNGTDTYINAATGGKIQLRVNNSAVIYMDTTGKLGINQASPGAMLHATASSTSTIGAIVQGLSSQTGVMLQLQGTSSTATARAQVDIDTAAVDNTDATRKYQGILRAWDTSAREAFRWGANGSAATAGFFGTTPAIQQTGDIGTALVTYGLLTSPSLSVANGGTGTGTAFTQGSVVFAGASGVYSQDNSNFFWDSTNHRLGIGTTSFNGTYPTAQQINVPNGGTGLIINLTGLNYDEGALRIFDPSGAQIFSIVAQGQVSFARGGYGNFLFRMDPSLALQGDQGGLKLANNFFTQWSSTGNWYDTLDLGIGRIGAGQMQITNGGTATTGFGSLLYGVSDSGTTNVPIGSSLRHNSSGTPAAGFGVAQQFQLDSSTTAGRAAGEIDVTWVTATDATRKARMALGAYDTAFREGIRIDASGSAAMIGVFGTSAAVQQSGDIGDALVTYGWLTSPSLKAANGGTGSTKGAPKPLFDHFADANNTGTTETDLYSDTLTAGVLANNGEKISAYYSGTFTGAASATQQLRAYFGGTLVFDSGALSIGVSSPDWVLYIEIIRESSSIVRCAASFTSTSAALSAYADYVKVTGLTLSNTQILKITGTAAGIGGGSNQITASMATEAWAPAA